MSTVNTIKTRILNKYDVLANYSNFTPLKGEVCIAVVGETTTTNQGLHGDISKKPIVAIKVGDGTNKFNDLPWIQAIAGDVSSFVKGIVDEAKFNELVNTLITNAKLASADELNSLIQRVDTAEEKITNIENAINTGDNSLANLRTAINNVLGTSTDVASANTVYGAKKYAEEKATAAQSAAEATASADATAKANAAQAAAEEKVTALQNGAVKDNADAIGSINAKIGTTEIGTDITAAIKTLQDSVGTSGENSLGSRVDALETTIGNASEGLVKDVADLKAADNNFTSRIDGIEDRVEINEGKLTGITGTVADTINSVDAKAEQNKTDIATEKERIDILVGSDTEKSVRDIAVEETAKIVAGADTNYDTLKEIADWIKSDTTGAAEMANDITEMQNLLGVTEGEDLPATVDSRITSAINGLNISQYATNDIVNGVEQRVKAIEDAPYATTGNVKDAKDEVIGASGDEKTANTIYGAKAFATDAAATAKSEAISDAASAADAKYELIGVAETKVNTLATGAVKNNTDAIDSINSAIDAMDAEYADTNAGVMTAITQVDGKITSVTQRKIKSADLDTDDVFVFYCGNATGYAADMNSIEI